MIAVYLPALVMEIYSIYYTIRVVAFKLPVLHYTLIELCSINSTIVLPSLIAIYVASQVTRRGKLVSNLIGKYSNDCEDISNLLKVKIIITCNLKLEIFNLQVNDLITIINSREMALSCGFFKIDLTLCFTIFAAITTYMIIICQFQKDFFG